MDFPHRHGHGRRDDDDDSDGRRRHHAPPPAGHDEDRRGDDYGRRHHVPPPAGHDEDNRDRGLAYGRDDGGYGGRAPAPAYGRDDDGYGGRAPAPAYGRDDDGYGGRHPAQTAYGRDDGGYGGRAPAPAYGRDDDGYGGRAPAPAYGNVVHVSHEVGDERPHYGGGGSGYGNEARPHHGGGGGAAPRETFRIVCKAGADNYSLAARDGKVCLIRTNRDDDTQHWIKDLKYSTKVKDEEGYPAIALINKVTGEALKHSLGKSHPVQLTRYNSDHMDESVLWTESRDVGEGWRCIRMVNNIYLNFDALNGDKDHGGVRDGTTLVLWEWCEGDNQRWKILSWNKCVHGFVGPSSAISIIN